MNKKITSLLSVSFISILSLGFFLIPTSQPNISVKEFEEIDLNIKNVYVDGNHLDLNGYSKITDINGNPDNFIGADEIKFGYDNQNGSPTISANSDNSALHNSFEIQSTIKSPEQLLYQFIYASNNNYRSVSTTKNIMQKNTLGSEYDQFVQYNKNTNQFEILNVKVNSNLEIPETNFSIEKKKNKVVYKYDKSIYKYSINTDLQYKKPFNNIELVSYVDSSDFLNTNDSSDIKLVFSFDYDNHYPDVNFWNGDLNIFLDSPEYHGTPGNFYNYNPSMELEGISVVFNGEANDDEYNDVITSLNNKYMLLDNTLSPVSSTETLNIDKEYSIKKIYLKNAQENTLHNLESLSNLTSDLISDNNKFSNDFIKNSMWVPDYYEMMNYYSNRSYFVKYDPVVKTNMSSITISFVIFSTTLILVGLILVSIYILKGRKNEKK